MKKFKNSFVSIYDFVGKDAIKFFFLSIFIGLFLFVVEYSFVYILQGFLVSIELLDISKSFLPSWYPRSSQEALLALVLFGVSRGLVYFFKNYISGSANQAFLRFQRSKIIHNALHSAGQSSTSEIVSIFNELATSSGIVVSRSCEFIVSLLCTSLLFIMGLRLAPYELTMSIIILSICLLPLKLLNKRISTIGDNSRKEWFGINDVLLVGIKNNFFLRVYGLIETEISKGRNFLLSYENYLKRYLFFASVKSSLPLIFGILIVSLTSFTSINYFKTSSMHLVAFIYIFIRLSQGASELINLLNEISLHKGALLKLSQWSQATKKLEMHQFHEDSFNIEKINNILIDNISFGFIEDEFIFENFSFEIVRHDKLLIKGKSGAGKSTLVSLLLGANTPLSGKIMVNGYELEKVLNHFYKRISYVGAEPFLIPDSIRANLVYGLKEPSRATDKDLIQCLREAEIYDTLIEKGMNLDTLILESAQLSTGQKQRLSIARSLLRKSDLLILDEATANLDLNTEEKIMNNIFKFHGDITLIVVSHKNSFDKMCNKIIDL